MRISSTSGGRGLLLLCACTILATAACDETVDAVLDSDQAYTFYGFLNPRADTQAVRIFPVASTLTPEVNNPLDGTVTSTDLETGETAAWQDTIVAFPDGTNGYVAFAPFHAVYGHSYRFTVTRSDGVTSEAVVPVPELVEAERLEPYTRTFPDRVRDAPFLPYDFNGDVRLIQVNVSYTLEALNFGTTSLTMRYDERAQRTAAGWRVEVDLALDEDVIRAELLRSGFISSNAAQLELRFITLSAMVVNPDWNPPGGRFDPELLVEPGTWTNVNNGFGFVGGGYVEEILVLPSGCHQFLAGFYIPEGNPCG